MRNGVAAAARRALRAREKADARERERRCYEGCKARESKCALKCNTDAGLLEGVIVIKREIKRNLISG